MTMNRRSMTTCMRKKTNGREPWRNSGCHYRGARHWQASRPLVDAGRRGRLRFRRHDAGIEREDGVDRRTREFALNGYPIYVEDTVDDEGVYCALYKTPQGETTGPDMMRLLIRDFLEGGSLSSPEESLANLEIMLDVLDRS